MEPVLFVIGGSAGSFEPLATVLQTLPATATWPVVIVVHIAPQKPSLMAQVLGHRVSRPVVEVEDKQPLVPGTIYVAPPNYHVLIERDHTLALSVDAQVHYSRPSIDVLFESAADALGARVVGLLLSGSNEDGAAGLASIARAGGVALVQDVATATHAVMPAAAVRMIPTAIPVAAEHVASHLAALAMRAEEHRS